MRCFLVAAECLNFSKTAMRLFVTQSTVSRGIFRLEEELETRLFDRSGLSLKLTDAGKVCLKDIRDIVRIEDEMRLKIKNIHVGEVGNLKIACYGKHEQTMLANICSSLHEKHPGITFNMRKGYSGFIVESLERYEVDLIMATKCELNNTKGTTLIPIKNRTSNNWKAPGKTGT